MELHPSLVPYVTAYPSSFASVISGQRLTGGQFALREDLSVGALRWWSSVLGRDTRAEHGRSTIEPIEIAVATTVARGTTGAVVEVAVGGAVIRCEPGVDVAYIAALVRAIAGR